jgi:HlyD family secretion protein
MSTLQNEVGDHTLSAPLDTRTPAEPAESSQDNLLSLLRDGRELMERRPAARRATPPRSSSSHRGDSSEDHHQDYEHPDYHGPARGRPTGMLQRTWIDPSEKPFTPLPRPGNAMVSRGMAWSVTAAFVALLAWIIIPEINFRLTSLNTVFLKNGVLSAQAVQIAPPRPAVVKELFIDASALPDSDLPAGTPIARLEGYSSDGLRTESSILAVPFDSRFASVDLLEGGVTYPGAPVATVYDPRRMYVIVSVQPETLDLLRRGMRASLSTAVFPKPISGTVISAVPLLGTDHSPTSAKLVNVRIKPDEETMSQLVPGVRFNAAIDLKSAPKGAPKLVFTIESLKKTPGPPTGPVGSSANASNSAIGPVPSATKNDAESSAPRSPTYNAAG